MTKVNIRQAKTHLSRLIREALKGRTVVICKRNKPLVKLMPVQSDLEFRRIGSAKGLVELSPDFDAPLVDFTPYIECREK
jgi:prevent-host-death family protein